MDDRAVARNVGINRHRQIGIDKGQSAVGVEGDGAAIDTAAEDEVIVVLKQLSGAGCLQRAADCGRSGGGSVERSIGSRVAGIAASRRAGDRIVVLIEQGELVAERRGDRVRSGEPLVRETQMIAELRTGAAAATLDFR